MIYIIYLQPRASDRVVARRASIAKWVEFESDYTQISLIRGNLLFNISSPRSGLPFFLIYLPQLLSDVFCWASKDVHRDQNMKMYTVSLLKRGGDIRDVYISLLNIANGIVALSMVMVMLSSLYYHYRFKVTTKSISNPLLFSPL